MKLIKILDSSGKLPIFNLRNEWYDPTNFHNCLPENFTKEGVNWNGLKKSGLSVRDTSFKEAGLRLLDLFSKDGRLHLDCCGQDTYTLQHLASRKQETGKISVLGMVECDEGLLIGKRAGTEFWFPAPAGSVTYRPKPLKSAIVDEGEEELGVTLQNISYLGAFHTLDKPAGNKFVMSGNSPVLFSDIVKAHIPVAKAYEKLSSLGLSLPEKREIIARDFPNMPDGWEYSSLRIVPSDGICNELERLGRSDNQGFSGHLLGSMLLWSKQRSPEQYSMVSKKFEDLINF